MSMKRFDNVVAGELIGPITSYPNVMPTTLAAIRGKGHPLMLTTEEIKQRLSAVACLGSQGEALAGAVQSILKDAQDDMNLAIRTVRQEAALIASRESYESDLQRAYDDGYAKGEEDARGNFVGADEQEVITSYFERNRLFTAEAVDDLIAKVASEQAGPKVKSVLNDLRERFSSTFENSGTEVA